MAGPDGRHSSSSRVTGSPWSIDPVRAGIRIILGYMHVAPRRHRSVDQRQPLRASVAMGTHRRPRHVRSTGRRSQRVHLVDRTPSPDSPRPSPHPTSCRRSRCTSGRTCSRFRLAGSRASSARADPRLPTSSSSSRWDAEWRCCALRDYGIYGNGNLMLMERNNHEVFTVIRDWLDKNVK